ncbi:hypothetical protein DXZ20_01315 [Leptolyngbyaceae cyanobacterium CCMR0081]|uniref:Uncharacterized protein n=1 Tax=Adonisia turfae CCMR0081 TaxID=2292702 RepID=A0A6M0RDI1_9CYAN|nr:hypothetical protein [Adonisia turfae CCMR0081]
MSKLLSLVIVTVFLGCLGCSHHQATISDTADLQSPSTNKERSLSLFSINSSDGIILITTNNIASYDWESHTITLKPGVKERLLTKLTPDLVSGHPFQLTAKGQPIYDGNFITSLSSITLNTPVIDLQSFDRIPLREDQIRIELGYPTEDFFQGHDPRNADAIYESLKEANILKD